MPSLGVVAAGAGGASMALGAGDGDEDPFRRLRRRAERSVSGVDCFGVGFSIAFGLTGISV